MNKPSRHYLTIAALAAALIALYWLLPISGKLAYVPDAPPQLAVWPQINVVNKADNELEIIVQDATPWVFVRLEMADAETTLVEHGAQNAAGVWQWKWQARHVPDAAPVNLYYNCDTGCQLWATVKTAVTTPIPDTNQLIPTKLGLVFANPAREWRGRQGWDVEITYAQLAEEPYWGIDDLAQRVRQANDNGLRVLVRVEYDQGQSLPPPDDYAALDLYLRYLRRLARDQRLAGVYGFIIGSNYNTAAANSQTPENPVTPAWYARVFNGYNTDPAGRDNALETIRSENSQTRVIVGPAAPWNSDQNGAKTWRIDVPWLNYMNSVAAAVNAAAAAKMEQGVSGAAPDGFAIQAFGRVDDPQIAPGQRAQEPLTDLYRAEWGTAQAGFRVYRDWLEIINRYEYTAGKPVYINAANTFDGKTGSLPADNYPPGWLSNALKAVNQEPQIEMLAWFLDSFPHDDQWVMFSLTAPRGLLVDAAQEFDALLREE